MDAVREYVSQGGFFMYPIIGGAVWALTLCIERTFFYIQTGSNLKKQTRSFFSILESSGTGDAQEYLSGKKGLISSVLAAGCAAAGQGPLRAEEKMATVLTSRLPAYSRYLNLLATLAGLMPIFGLLGTVTGMIATFNVIALQGTGDAQAMAAGIAEALITTQAGLVAAAPVILVHVLLLNRLKRITDTAREACTRLLDYMKDHHAA
jgi:biopolymer transport protein ExbB